MGRVNILGLLMFLGCMIIFGLSKLFLHKNIAIAIACVVMSIADLIYRKVITKGKLFKPNNGGMLFFMPVWIFSAVICLVVIFAVKEF